jgi:hypothetical protein
MRVWMCAQAFADAWVSAYQAELPSDQCRASPWSRHPDPHPGYPVPSLGVGGGAGAARRPLGGPGWRVSLLVLLCAPSALREGTLLATIVSACMRMNVWSLVQVLMVIGECPRVGSGGEWWGGVGWCRLTGRLSPAPRPRPCPLHPPPCAPKQDRREGHGRVLEVYMHTRTTAGTPAGGEAIHRVFGDGACVHGGW